MRTEFHLFKPYTSANLPLKKATKELLREIISSPQKLTPKKIDRPVILYGAGNLGKMAKNFFDNVGLTFSYVVDIYPHKQRQDMFWKNLKIVAPADAENNDKKNNLLVICIVNAPLIPLRDKLLNDGWKNIAFFYDISHAYRNRHPLNNGWFLEKLDDKAKYSAEKVFSFLADDVSRAHYLQFVAWRKLRLELSFDGANINTFNRFFIPEVTGILSKNEFFVDCGAHTGLVTEKFLELTHNKYNKILAIEPDGANSNILQEKLRGTPRVEILRFSLCDQNGKGRFYEGYDFSSKLGRNGNSIIDTRTLDGLNIPATFIKMHLEGGELHALHGSLQTIKKYRPILAVTVYHNEMGVSKIPLFLMENAKNYKLYFRLHSWAGTGAVLYAIPIEKLN